MKMFTYPSTPLTRQASLSGMGGIGIIYFHLQHRSGGPAGDAVFRRWASFVDVNLSLPGLTRLDIAGKQWISRDLFLYVRLPDGGRNGSEEWLLRTAQRLRGDWTERFAGLHAEAGVEFELRAGVSVFERSSVKPMAGDWYDSMKRAVIHGQQAESLDLSLRRLTFEQIMTDESVYPVFQPIYALKGDRIFGFEALTRIAENEWFRGPQQLFDFAEEVKESYRLDRLTREKAIACCRGVGGGQKLFINVMTHLMDDPRFTPGCTLRLLEERGLSPGNVVFELNERSSIEDFDACKKMLAHYRSQGYEIAIDDVGAGYSSLQSIVELRPDYIKIDRSLVSGIHRDEMKEHIMGTFTSFASKMGIGVIAEGIEHQEELDKVREMGVDYAQGYLLGRPAAIDA